MEADLIERYFREELTPAERGAFEQRLAADPAFRREVEEHGKAVRLVRLQGRQALKARLAERGRQLDAEKARSGFRLPWRMAPLAAALLALAWWFWDRQIADSSTPLPGTEIRRDSAETPAPPTPGAAEQAEPMPSAENSPSAEPPVEESSSSHEQLFAAFFRPYHDESLEPAVRGEGEPTPEEQFRQLYWEGRYREALAAFEALENASKSNGNLQFLQANCLLATGQAKEAALALENILRTGRSRFLPEAQWLLALAYLKDGDREKAKALLQQMAKNGGSPMREEAEDLLEKIE
ncbi:MAG: hypothetical protein J5I98_26065 [Phaeodactylibacter sp.]|nr:hypothetical protein [Phaeodactylibacter sp.]